MGFDDLVSKGKEFMGSEQGKDLEQDLKKGYETFNKTEGTYTDKAKAAYSEYSADSKKEAESEKKDSEKK